jgi:vacuolar-type H+-ATPase subunit I/STV1
MESSSKQVIRLAGKILGAAGGISLVVLLIGTFLRWDDPVKFSNGFFVAGAILIVAGVFSVTGGFMQRSNFGVVYSESAGQANIAERNQRMAAEVTQRYGTFIFLLTTGLLLIGISVVVDKFL